ncbi:cytochrome P450 [Lactarius deliciosus]|nr:cytochrome P450 [Lactarius deliciosus]
MVKEALRWDAVEPVGPPHRSLEDDWYEGMFIPKGTICIANVWHLNLDLDFYGEDGAHFNPTRHLYANGEIAPGPPDAKKEGHFAYGFGRRSCVGCHVANDSLFINITTTFGAQTRANERPHRPTSSLGWMRMSRWKLVLSCEYDSPCDPKRG